MARGFLVILACDLHEIASGISAGEIDPAETIRRLETLAFETDVAREKYLEDTDCQNLPPTP